MVNFLGWIEHPQINHEKFFEVMRDFRKGGLNPIMYDEFIDLIGKLKSTYPKTSNDYSVFNRFNLKDITEEENSAIIREVMRRGIEKSKICWHPNAGVDTCNVDSSKNIIVSAAHSIQNNGVLSNIVENGHVMSYALDKGEFEGKEYGKNYASIFWGFCNKHDAIFRPIEVVRYNRSEEQNFLFAYRGFVVSSHKKLEVSSWMQYGEQSSNDIVNNKKIFDDAILINDFSVIETEVFELPLFYPIAVSSSFYLDFDFEGNPILHSDDRMEDVFVTLLPTEDNKTYFLLSYFKRDRHLYKSLGMQLRKRNNLKSDLTMLIAAHVENIYFNPVYYRAHIEKFEEDLIDIINETQMDHALLDKNNEITSTTSLTPRYYLNNPKKINFFGY